MSNILNKSSHPVHVNRIPIRIWKLRDEIEEVISRRIQESEQKSEQLDVSDIKKFYSREKKDYSMKAVESLDEQGSDLDSSGNEMDEDALEMAKALAGDTDDESSEPEKMDDDEAQKLAEMMLADQDTPQDQLQEINMDLKKDSASEMHSSNMRVLPNKDKVSTGFAFLSDMDMTKVLMFSKTGFTLGQNICIEFLIPNSFIMTGEVVGSNHVGRNSKIISRMKPDFRVMTSFSFLFDEERENLRDFLKSVEPDIPPPPKRLKRPADDDNDDEFEDLGF
jgi:hypothetical protein